MRIIKDLYKISLVVSSLAFAPVLCADVVLDKTSDPMESLNREVFEFNYRVDALFIRPVATVYGKVLPPPAQSSIDNFLNNLGEIPTVANGILQGKFDQALRDTVRFGINSTLGLAGLFDVATELGIESHKEDFGKTLYAWGWKNTNYFVIPILGPSTVRDTFGLVGNLFMSAPAYLKPKWRNRYFALALVNRRKDAGEFEGVAQVAGVNYYNLVRSTYLQNRTYQLTGELATKNGSPDFGQPPA